MRALLPLGKQLYIFPYLEVKPARCFLFNDIPITFHLCWWPSFKKVFILVCQQNNLKFFYQIFECLCVCENGYLYANMSFTSCFHANISHLHTRHKIALYYRHSRLCDSHPKRPGNLCVCLALVILYTNITINRIINYAKSFPLIALISRDEHYWRILWKKSIQKS